MPKNATETMTKKQKTALLVFAFVIAPVTIAATGAYFVARALDPDQAKTAELCRSMQAGQPATLTQLSDAAKSAGLQVAPTGKDNDFQLFVFGGGLMPLRCGITAKDGKITLVTAARF